MNTATLVGSCGQIANATAGAVTLNSGNASGGLNSTLTVNVAAGTSTYVNGLLRNRL